MNVVFLAEGGTRLRALHAQVERALVDHDVTVVSRRPLTLPAGATAIVLGPRLLFRRRLAFLGRRVAPWLISARLRHPVDLLVITDPVSMPTAAALPSRQVAFDVAAASGAS